MIFQNNTSTKIGKTAKIRLSTYAGIILFLLVYPFIGGEYQASLLNRYLVFGLFAMSFDLLWGYVGIINFGHAVFFGLGSYSVGLIMKYLQFPGASVIAGISSFAVPMMFAFIIGYFLFYGKVTGVYFAIVTMALSLLMQAVAIAVDFAGGLDGLRGFSPITIEIPRLFSLRMHGTLTPYYMTILLAVSLFFLSKKIVSSSFGRVMEALRNNPDRVEALGYDVPKLKLIIFIIACGIAGVAGSLYVPIGHISPEILGLLFSTSALVWVSIGGRGTLIGGFIGALVVSYLQYFLGAKLQNLWYLLIGVFFVIVVLFRSGGIMGFFKKEKIKEFEKQQELDQKIEIGD